MSDNIKRALEYILSSEQTHYEEDPSENHIFRIAQKALEELNTKKSVDIDRVIMVLLDGEDMEAVSKDYDITDYWATLEVIEDENLQKFITQAQLKALKNGDADYIAFRLDY